MILKHKAELAGRVKLQISGGERGTIDYDWFDNMILDQGLRAVLTKSETFSVMLRSFAVGGSSQPVAPSDTGLITPIALIGFSGVESGYNATGGFGWSRCVKTFPRGVAAGNISELSTSFADNYTSAVARTLVKDQAGEPITITVLADEVLTITWEFRRWWASPSAHLIDYTIDSTPRSTTCSYTPEAAMLKTEEVLGSAGHSGFGGTLVGDFRATLRSRIGEGSGNPAISSATPPRLDGSSPAFPAQGSYVTFTPPIPKTNEFRCDIIWELTLSRRGE